MGSSALNRSLAARAAAILTTAEVAASALDINDAAVGTRVLVDIAFTLGSLTNVILRAYVSMDGSTWQVLGDAAANTANAATLTADNTSMWSLPLPTGAKFFRVTAQGTGTVTSSSLALTYRYVRRGAR